MRLILASQSSARRRLLKRLGLRFEVRPAHLNEAAIARRTPAPRRLVRLLAEGKAQAVWDRECGGKAPTHVAKIPSQRSITVIGSDQVLVCAGRIYGKPGTAAKAQSQLKRFSGRTIQLLTAVCVISPDGRRHSFVNLTKMRFRRLSVGEIAAYVAADNPLDCAGSFKFELRGIGLFDAVQAEDPTAIEGLPLIELGHLLRKVCPNLIIH